MIQLFIFLARQDQRYSPPGIELPWKRIAQE